MKRGRKLLQIAARLPDCARPLMAPTVANILMILLIALCFSGCATARMSGKSGMSVETWRKDSAFQLALDSVREVLTIRRLPMNVPKTLVTLTIPMDSLLKLPAGAAYIGRDGQTSVKVSRKPATGTEPESLCIEASGDSIQLLAEVYERTTTSRHQNIGQHESQQSSSYEEEQVKKPPNAVRWPFKWLLYGILGGILITKIKNIFSIIKKFTRL